MVLTRQFGLCTKPTSQIFSFPGAIYTRSGVASIQFIQASVEQNTQGCFFFCRCDICTHHKYTWRTTNRPLHASAHQQQHPCQPARAVGRCTLPTSWHHHTAVRTWIMKQPLTLPPLLPLIHLTMMMSLSSCRS
jgi:hypothetical protein